MGMVTREAAARALRRNLQSEELLPPFRPGTTSSNPNPFSAHHLLRNTSPLDPGAGNMGRGAVSRGPGGTIPNDLSLPPSPGRFSCPAPSRPQSMERTRGIP